MSDKARLGLMLITGALLMTIASVMGSEDKYDAALTAMFLWGLVLAGFALLAVASW